MPLVRIDLRRGKSPAYRKALCDGVYSAMREAFNVPEDDRFTIVSEHEANNFVFAESYLDISHTDELVIIQITANDTRTVAQKQVRSPASPPCFRKTPAYVRRTPSSTLSNAKKRKLSFGNGIAQYV